jgi:hypothetical protein
MCIIGIGGADGIRTHYLLTASQTLSQLSYSPTSRSLAKNSNKLNHLHPSDNLTKHGIINRHANHWLTPKKKPRLRER